MLKNGEILRGRISEWVPGVSVKLLLVDGTTRTLAMAEVAHAGPANVGSGPAEPVAAGDAPAPAAPPTAPAPPSTTAPPTRLRVTFRANVRELTFYEQSSSGATPVLVMSPNYTGFGVGFPLNTRQHRLCEAPCELELPPGRYELSVRHRRSLPVFVDQKLTVIDRPVVVTAQHTSRRTVRTVGAFVSGGSFVVGSALIIAGIDDDEPTPATITGMTLFVVSLLTCWVPFVRDHVRVQTTDEPSGTQPPTGASRRDPSEHRRVAQRLPANVNLVGLGVQF
jgi:hypothetical protein